MTDNNYGLKCKNIIISFIPMYIYILISFLNVPNITIEHTSKELRLCQIII